MLIIDLYSLGVLPWHLGQLFNSRFINIGCGLLLGHFTHNIHGYLANTGSIVGLSQCQ